MRFGNTLNWTYIYLCLLTWAVETIFKINSFSTMHIDVVVLLMAFYTNARDVFFRKAFTSGPILIWGLWTIYSVGNWFICPHSSLTAETHAHWYWEIFSLSRTYFMLSILYYEACLDFPRAIKLLTYAFITYFIVGVVGQWDGPMRDEKTWEGRNGTILGNHFPLNMLCSFVVLTLANIYGYVKSRNLMIWACCVMFVIMWVATRKAMIGIFLMTLFYYSTSMKPLSFNNILKLAFTAGVMYFFFDLALENTLVGQRMNELKNFEYQIDVPVWLTFLGDRAIQYVLAWEVFLQHPLHGVGLGNSMDYTGLPFPIHSEYMEQLCEGGLLGTAIYVWFNILIFKCIYNAFSERSPRVAIICSGGMAVLLFLSFTAWLYNMPCFFVIYALVIAYCNPQSAEDIPAEYSDEDASEQYYDDSQEAYA